MNFTVELFVKDGPAGRASIAEVAPAVERARFEAIGHTDRPGAVAAVGRFGEEVTGARG